MKKCVIIALLVLLGCAKTPLDQAKKSVSKNIGLYLNDPSYYKSVAWGPLDSAFKETIIDYPMDIKDEIQIIDEYGISQGYDLIERKNAIRKFLASKGIMTPNESDKPVFIGYTISHTFRARGPKKDKVLMKYLFILDSTYTVTDAKKQVVKAFDSSNP